MPPRELQALREKQAEAAEHEKNKTAHFSAVGRTFAGGGRGAPALSLSGRGRGGISSGGIAGRGPPPPPPPK